MASLPSPVELQQSFGVLFDGFVLSMIGYGLTFFQTYVYFGQYSSDHWAQKSFVALIFSLDTVSAALVSKSIYFYLVTQIPYIVPLAQLDLNSSLNTHILLSEISVFGVHMCYSARIWELSRSIWVAGISIFFSVAAFALGIAMVAMTYKTPVFAHLAAVPLRVVFSLACAFLVLASLSIFLALTQFSPKTSRPRPSSALEWLDKISQYVLAHGLIMVILQLGCLVTLLSLPHKIDWIPVYSSATKASINALLFMLNSRQAHHGKGVDAEHSTIGFRAGNSSNTGRLTAVGDMFKSAPSDASKTIEITRTVEFDPTITGGDLDKSVYGSDHMYRNDTFHAVGANEVKIPS